MKFKLFLCRIFCTTHTRIFYAFLYCKFIKLPFQGRLFVRQIFQFYRWNFLVFVSCQKKQTPERKLETTINNNSLNGNCEFLRMYICLRFSQFREIENWKMRIWNWNWVVWIDWLTKYWSFRKTFNLILHSSWVGSKTRRMRIP